MTELLDHNITIVQDNRDTGEPMPPTCHPGRMAPFVPITAALQKEIEMLNRVVAGDTLSDHVIWETEQCLVAPEAFARTPGFNQARAEAEAAGWPVHLRSTGGDVTPQGAAIINVSIAYAPPAGDPLSIATTYEQLCRPILNTLELSGLRGSLGAINGAFCNGAYNINIDGRKFAGTAQRWKRTGWDRSRFAVFSHALLLMETPADAAIDAINNLYKTCGLSRRVRRDVHVGLSQAAPHGAPLLTPHSFINALRARYATQLEALTIDTAAGPPAVFRHNEGQNNGTTCSPG